MGAARATKTMVRPSRSASTSLPLCVVVAAATAAGCQGAAFFAATADASEDAAREVPDAPSSGADVSLPPRDAASARDVVAASTQDGATASDGQAGAPAACADAGVPPATLECTGLYADVATKVLGAGVRFYQPAVPLWSDAAQKSRWIKLPPGTQIAVSNPSEWSFPVGTKVWKEFAKNGKRIETRLFQKVDNGPPPIWAHATYAWNADETAAVTSGGGDVPIDSDGGTWHIPTFAECDECHKGRSDRLLGFEQVSLGLQGAQGLTLPELVSEGLLTPVPSQTQLVVGDDGTGAAAPALEWLHVNCGVTCHNANSNATAYGAGMRLRLDPTLLDGRALSAADVDSLRTTVGVPATSPGWVQPVHWPRIAPGDPTHSLLVQLISHRGKNNPAGGQMPPIATSIVDTDDVAKVVAWVSKLPPAALPDGGSDAGADGAMDLDAEADANTAAGD